MGEEDEGAWTVPKGEFGEGETPWAVARREFEEETGHPAPDGVPIELGDIRQKGGKVVAALGARGRPGPGGRRTATPSRWSGRRSPAA